MRMWERSCKVANTSRRTRADVTRTWRQLTMRTVFFGSEQPLGGKVTQCVLQKKKNLHWVGNKQASSSLLLGNPRTSPIELMGLDGRVFGQIKQTTRLWTPLSAPDLSRSANEGCAAPRVAHGEICSTSFQFEVVSRDAVYTVNASTNVHPYGYFP